MIFQVGLYVNECFLFVFLFFFFSQRRIKADDGTGDIYVRVTCAIDLLDLLSVNHYATITCILSLPPGFFQKKFTCASEIAQKSILNTFLLSPIHVYIS